MPNAWSYGIPKKKPGIFERGVSFVREALRERPLEPPIAGWSPRIAEEGRVAAEARGRSPSTVPEAITSGVRPKKVGGVAPSSKPKPAGWQRGLTAPITREELTPLTKDIRGEYREVIEAAPDIWDRFKGELKEYKEMSEKWGPLFPAAIAGQFLWGMTGAPISEFVRAAREPEERRPQALREVGRGLAKPFVDPWGSFQEAPLGTTITWAFIGHPIKKIPWKTPVFSQAPPTLPVERFLEMARQELPNAFRSTAKAKAFHRDAVRMQLKLYEKEPQSFPLPPREVLTEYPELTKGIARQALVPAEEIGLRFEAESQIEAVTRAVESKAPPPAIEEAAPGVQPKPSVRVEAEAARPVETPVVAEAKPQTFTVFRAGTETTRLTPEVPIPPDTEGIYFAETRDIAQSYVESYRDPSGKSPRKIREYEVTLKNPATHAIEDAVIQGLEQKAYAEKQPPEWLERQTRAELMRQGYDGVVRTNGEIVVFNSESITLRKKPSAKPKPPPTKATERPVVTEEPPPVTEPFSTRHAAQSLGVSPAEIVRVARLRETAQERRAYTAELAKSFSPKAIDLIWNEAREFAKKPPPTKGTETPVVSKKAPLAPEPTPEPTVTGEAKAAEGIRRWLQRAVHEEQGRIRLEDIIDEGLSAREITDQFWQDTYFKLPPEIQSKFQQYLRNITDAQPGEIIATRQTPKGTKDIIAKTWADVADFADLPTDPAMLEGIERGFVVLMQEANRRFPTRPAVAPVERPVVAEKAAVVTEPTPVPKPGLLTIQAAKIFNKTPEQFVAQAKAAPEYVPGIDKRLETKGWEEAKRDALFAEAGLKSPRAKAGPEADVIEREVIGYTGATEIALPRARVEAKPITTEPVKASTIVKELDEVFAPIRTGRFLSRKFAGIFKVRENVIRLKVANRLPVVAHEVGHSLHKLLWPEARTAKRRGLSATAFPREYWSELTPLAYKGAKGKVVEGYAEYIRLWLTDPAQAAERAPNFHKFFSEKLAKYPQVKKVLEKAQSDIQRWIEQPAALRVRSSISRNEPSASRGWTADRLYTMVVDELRPLQVAEREIAKGGKIPETESAFLEAWRGLRGLSGRAEEWLLHKRADQYGKPTGKSLRDVLEPVAEDLEGFSDYAVSIHALDVLKSGKTMPLSGADYRTVVDTAPGHYRKVLTELVGYQDALLKELVDAGLLSSEAKAKMRAKWPNHVPLYRVFEEATGRPGMGRGQANLPQAIKRLKGSGRDIVDPIESIVKDTYMFLNLAARNRTMVKLTNLAGRFEDAGRIVEIDLPPKMRPTSFTLDEILRGPEREALAEIGLDAEATRTVFRPTYLPSGKENIVVVYKDGKPRLYQLESELYNAVMAQDRLSVDVLTKMLATPASLLRAGATLTPEFAMRNPVRDIGTAMINSQYGLMPWDFVRGLFNVLGRSELYHQFKASGAAHANLVSLDRNYLQGSLRNVMRQSVKEKVIDAVTHPIDTLRAISEATEEATRVAEFGKGTKWGKEASPNARIRAAIGARDVTIDFARAGTLGKKVNMVTAFFNAAVGGMDKMARTFKEHPARSTLRATAYITTPTVILYALNRNDPRYQERQEWEKDLFWFIPTPEGKPLIRIPKPFELGVIFASFPERVLRWLDQKDPHAFDDFTKSLWETGTPNILPTVLLPWVQTISNRAWTGLPIVPRREEYLPKPLQYGPQTSAVAILLGQALNQSPRKIDTLIRGYTGGLGSYALDAIGYGIERAGGIERPPKVAKPLSGQKVIRAFLANELSSPVQVNRMYDRLSELEERDKKAEAEIGKPLSSNEQMELKMLEKRAKALSALRKLERAIQETTDQTELSAILESNGIPAAVGPIEKQKLVALIYLRERAKGIAIGTEAGGSLRLRGRPKRIEPERP